MKQYIYLLLLIFVLTQAHISACDIPFNPQWEKVIVEILKFDTSRSKFSVHGTGIIVLTYDTNSAFLLISNKHILQHRSDLWIRVNLDSSSTKSVDTISLEEMYGLSHNTIFPSDTLLDLAALPMPMKGRNWDILSFPKSHIATKPEIKKGMEIYYLGFPLGISIPTETTPLYRHGVIALDRENSKGNYLIDGIVLGGSSGSPVFNCNGTFLGILRGHWDIATEKRVLNYGLGFMIPVDRIVEFMNEVRPGWSER